MSDVNEHVKMDSYYAYINLSKIAEDDILFFFFFFFFFFSEKIGLGISCESSARQTIHMNCHVLFSLKNRNSRLLQLCLALRVNLGEG